MLTTTTTAMPKASRHSDLKAILENRRRDLLEEVQDRIRDVRSDRISDRDVLDSADSSEASIQDDIGFALIQMKTETLSEVETALCRIEEGNYGDCFECGRAIAEARLRALPFAVRCKDCEESREAAEQRGRIMAQRRGSPALFLDTRS